MHGPMNIKKSALNIITYHMVRCW